MAMPRLWRGGKKSMRRVMAEAEINVFTYQWLQKGLIVDICLSAAVIQSQTLTLNCNKTRAGEW